MPNTPNYNLPYPALSDPPNGPSQIAGLASALDLLLGTAGRRVLAATSGAVDTAVKTTHFIACTASFADPGYPYYLAMIGGIRFSKFETSWDFYIQTTPASTVVTPVNGVLSASFANNMQKWFPVNGIHPTVMTGGQTLAMTAIKSSGDPGNGGQAYAATKFTAVILPAPG